MIKSLILLTLATSTLAFAETTTMDVSGIHCAGCKKKLEDSVCKSEEVTKNAESCEVAVTQPKKRMGKITIVAKKDMKINTDTIKAAVQVEGEDFKVKKVATK